MGKKKGVKGVGLSPVLEEMQRLFEIGFLASRRRWLPVLQHLKACLKLAL